MGAQAPIRLSAVEESILVWERASAPWTVQYDVTAPRLDQHRLREAWNAALSAHEMGSWRLRVAPGRGVAWEPSATAADIGPIEVVECADEAAVRRLRDTLLDSPSSIDGPLVRAVVARRADGDVLLANHSHVLADAVGGLRLLASVDRAYRGLADPPPAVDVTTARRALAPTTSRTGVPGLLARWSSGLRLAATASLPRVRVAGQGGGSPGFGAVVATVDAGAVAVERTRLGATFDAHLVAAVHVTVDRWNRARGGPEGHVGVAFGVNLRPSEWVRDVVANLAAFVSVVTEPAQRADVASALEVAGPAMEPELRTERARLAVEASRAASAVPLDVRRRMFSALPADRFDSIAVSNLGPVEPPTFGDGPGCVSVAAPAVPPVGISVLALSIGDELRITTAFRRERFDDDGALAFTEALAACLVGG